MMNSDLGKRLTKDIERVLHRPEYQEATGHDVLTVFMFLATSTVLAMEVPLNRFMDFCRSAYQAAKSTEKWAAQKKEHDA